MSHCWSPLPRRTASSPSTWPARATCSPARCLGIDSDKGDERAHVAGVAHLPPAREHFGATRLPDHRTRKRHELLADVLVPHRIVGVAQRIADLDHMTSTTM